MGRRRITSRNNARLVNHYKRKFGDDLTRKANEDIEYDISTNEAQETKNKEEVIDENTRLAKLIEEKLPELDSESNKEDVDGGNLSDYTDVDEWDNGDGRFTQVRKFTANESKGACILSSESHQEILMQMEWLHSEFRIP